MQTEILKIDRENIDENILNHAAEIIKKGTASLAMLSNLGLQDIQVRLLSAEMMYRHYLDNTKIDIQSLNL